MPSALAPPRYWLAARVTASTELRHPGRILGTAVRLGTQVFLVVCLWRSLYASTAESAGLHRDQAVTFAVLAVLVVTMRGPDRFPARDTVLQHVREGSILYWFVRPVPMSRYHLVRAAGDQAYGFAWAALAFVICLCFGVIQPPVSAGAGGVFVVSQLLGQVVVYHLSLLVDLLCFWTITNGAAVLILRLAQDVLSGTFAALWFFPAWFIGMSQLLPFQAVLNVPVSIYVGRIPLGSAGGEVLLQAGWCVLLAWLTRRLWRHAGQRVVIHGG